MTTQTVSQQLGLMNRLTGKTAAYESGKVTGYQQAINDVRTMLEKYRDEQPSGIPKALVRGAIIRLENRRVK